MTYIPPHVTQLDGAPSQHFNCWAATGAWLAAGASRGAIKPTPERFRRYARKPVATPGGIADVERGLRRLRLWWRGELLVDVPRAELAAMLLVDDGRIYGAESDFNVWPPELRCSPTFGDQPDAYHFIGIVGGAVGPADGALVRVMDPLCRRFRRVPVTVVVRAIVTYNNEHAYEEKGTADIIAVTPPRRDPPEEPTTEQELRQRLRRLRAEREEWLAAAATIETAIRPFQEDE